MKTSHKVIVGFLLCGLLITGIVLVNANKRIYDNNRKLHAISPEDVDSLKQFTQLILKP